MVRLRNALGATMDLPVTVSWTRVPFGVHVPLARLTSGDGSVPSGRGTVEPRAFSLRGSIYDIDRAKILAARDSLLRFLRWVPIDVWQQHTDDRFLRAYPTGVQQDWLDARAELVIDLPMVSPDPYWLGSAGNYTERITDSPHDWQVEVDGTAPASPKVTLRVRAGGSFEGFEIRNAGTGRKLKLTGDFAAADVLVVDTQRMTVMLNGTPALHLADDTWLLGGFWLDPGVQELEFEVGSGIPDIDLQLEWQSRWY